MKYEKERQQLIDCARKMEAMGLVALSGGNVSLRVGPDEVLITPSAMSYDTMVPEDIVLIDLEGNRLEGIRKPSSDMTAILYILKNMPRVKGVLHTHQPSATAFSLIRDELPVISTTMVDELLGPVKVAPFTISSDEGMGIQTVKYAGDSNAVMLKQHGVMAFGGDLTEALSAAHYLEESCDIYLRLLAAGCEIPVMTQEQIDAENRPCEAYGQ